jgi:sugar phosphate isomerase/epimerase
MPALTRRAAIQGLVSALPAASAQRSGVTVGAHPWVFAARQPGNDLTPILDQVFREIGSAGVDGIELMHTVLMPDGSVERVRELSKRYRLPVIGTSWSAPMWNREQHAKILAEAHTLLPRLQKTGGRTLGVSVGDARRRKTPAEFDAQADILRKVMKLSADHGVVVNLHNHIYEVRDGEFDLNNTLERVPEVKLGPDLNWLLRAGVDPVDFIRRRGKQIVFAHLRDQKAGGRWPEALGEGDMDYAAIGQALRDVGFQGDLVIELAHERDFQPTRTYGESFRLSREYVRRVMKY